MSPKAHKPAARSAIRVNIDRGGRAAKNIEYWKAWEAGWRPETYLKVPKGMGMFSVTDPRKREWRRNVKGK